MEHLNQPKRDWRKEEDNVKVALGELSYLMGWTMNHPQSAALLAFEAHQLAMRYTENPTPDELEMRVKIPLSIMAKWIKCHDVERAETLFLQAMNDEIARHNVEYVVIKANVPLSMYEQFEKACATLEGNEIEEEHLPAYVQSVLCKAIQNFIKQRKLE